MNLDYFKKIRILDGGIGQELLARGMKPKGTLWSANALLDENYHNLLLDIHLDFIKAGAEVIITNTFATRKIRLKNNNVENKFEYLNKKAGEIAQKAKKNNSSILIAGGLPPQNLTYEADTRSEDEIRENFNNQARFLNPFVDFFYFDVLSSIRELKIAIDSISEFRKPYLVGAHISEGTKLPSGEKISEIVKKIKHDKLLGVILACVSPENFEINLSELKNLGVPFGFKLNAFIKTKLIKNLKGNYNQSIAGNPNEFLGVRKDLTPEKILTFAKKFRDSGSTIFGGCCETKPIHIKALRTLK